VKERRNKPSINMTLSSDLLEQINRFCAELKWKRSQVMERLMVLGMARFEERFSKAKRQEPVEEQKEDDRTKGERLAEAHMRAMLFKRPREFGDE